jgi:hypothetical protein
MMKTETEAVRAGRVTAKLSVGPAIRFAFGFAFGQLGTIIGLIWAPMVAIAILTFLPHALGDTQALRGQDHAATSAAVLRGIVFWAANMLLSSCVYVAVTRQALGLRKGPAIFHFSMGMAELRMTGATLLLRLIVFVLAIGLVLALVAAGFLAGTNEIAAAGATAVLGICGACALLYAITRLGFLLVPVTVAENRITLERGWTLARGNFWRITSVLFVVTLPTLVVFLSAVFWLTGSELMALMPIVDKLTPEVLSDRIQTIFDAHIATIIGIQFIMAPFTLGLLLGAAAFAYKELAAGAPASQARVT